MTPSRAQEYSYAHYDVRDGLAGSVVYSVIQDHDGFIWFGTETGLSRFDGTRFKNFTTADGLPDNEIIKLFVDSKNRVWIVPFKNSICYYWQGKIHTAENDSLLRKLSITNEIKSIAENSKGEIAIMELNRLLIISPDNTFTSIASYKGGKLIFGFVAGLRDSATFEIGATLLDSGIYMFKVQHDKLEISRFLGATSFGMDSYRMRVPTYISPELQLLYTLGDSLDIFMSKTGETSSIALPAGFIKASYLNDSLIAISSSSVVQTYNYRRKTPDHIYFQNKNINNVIEDREGSLWFTSMGEGVYRLGSSEFKNYFINSGSSPSPVFIIKKFDSVLYAGSDHFRVLTVNLRDNAIHTLQLGKRASIGRVITIDKAGGKEMYFGTDMGLIKKINKERFFPIYTLSVKSTAISGDTVLIGGSLGIFTLKNKMNRVDTIWHGRATAIFKKDDLLYVGTLNGLYILTADKQLQYLGNLHPALKSRIVAIGGTPDGLIWIATYGNGVIGYKNGQVSRIVTIKDGLSSNICRTLFVTDSVLWIGTDKGLNKCSLTINTSIVKYTVEDGLLSNIINAIYVDKNIIYVGSSLGITYFDERKVMMNSLCRLRVTSIRCADRQWDYDTTNLQLGHYENNVRVEFSGISFKSAGDITYNYRLLGLDTTWQQTRDNFLNYPVLPSGSYELQLVAINKFGVKSEIVSINFDIDKLLWEKWWFQGLCVLFVGIGIWMLVSWRIKRIRQTEKIKAQTNQRITELEQMALKSQMNPHFIFNSLNSIQQYVIDKDIDGANKYIADFARLIRATLDISSRLKITLREEINYISTYLELEKIRFEGKFDYVVTVTEDIDISSTYIPPMILQPYVENSIRHGVRYLENNDGLIKIEFGSVNGFLVCSIEDNGVGRTLSRQYKGKVNIEYQSKGMRLTAERIAIMNRHSSEPVYIDIEDVCQDNNKAQGTKVIIKFPLQEMKTPE